MSPEEIHERQRYLARCDPKVPVLGDNAALYEPLDQGPAVRGDETVSCIDQMAQWIRLREHSGATCQLFTGFPGSGKTTELRRLAAQLEADRVVPTNVIFIDFENYIDTYTPISITDVLSVLAWATDRAATVEEAIQAGKDPDTVEVGYLRKLYDFVARLDPQIKSLGFDVYGAKLLLEIKDNPNFRQRVAAALQLRFQVFADEAMDVIRGAIARLQAVTHAQRVVIIGDGLEKLRPINEADREAIEKAAETVFVTHAWWLRLPVHAIYTFPFWLRFRAPALGALYDSQPRILPMVKIAEPSGQSYQPGLDKLVNLVGRRVNLDRAFGVDRRETLLPIVRASGGYPRDLLRMIRDVITEAPALPITPADAQRVVRRLAQTYEFVIRSPDVELLAEVARTHTLPEGDGLRLGSFTALFTNCLVLAYLNGREWYDLHPLVRLAPWVQKRLAATP